MAASSAALTFSRALRGGPVRPDQQRQLGQQLGQVQAQLDVARGDVAVARLEQHDAAEAGWQSAAAARARSGRGGVTVAVIAGVPVATGTGGSPG